jgi:hypothetical protein
LGILAAVLGLIVYNLARSPEWRAFDWTRFWASLVNARPGYLLAALAATLSSYLLRAIRWKYFLEPIKQASMWVLFAGQILGFSSIYLVGRPGEFVRPAYIARKEKVPITSMVAIWLLERIYDSVFLVLFFAAALFFARFDPTAARAGTILSRLREAGALMFVATAVLIGSLLLFRWRADSLTARILRWLGFLGARSRHHLEHFLRSFADGLRVIQSGKDLLASLLVTLVLWIVNASVFWFVFQSIGGGLALLTWVGAGMAMFFAVLGLAVQFPGIGGGYQVGIILALTELFSVPAEPATGAAILIWIMISVPCLVLGVIISVYEGLTFKKLEMIAAEERAAATEGRKID